MKPLCLLLSILALAACQRPAPPLRGGTATATLTGPTAASLTPADNPAAESRQTVRREETRQTAAPVPLVRVTETPTATGTVTVTEQFGQPPLVQTIKEETATTLGASQQDTSREISAKLASFAPIRWAGLGFLAFSLACFHPLIRDVVGGGKTIPALAATAGIICIFGPALFVGRETLVLVLLATGLALAFLLVRLSHKEGQADALRSSPPTPGG
jgi:hypothetical protein